VKNLFFEGYEMKKLTVSIMLLFVFTLVAFASNIISSFTATSDSDVIHLKWTTTTENNIKEFVVQRSLSSTSGFQKVYTEKATGNPSNYSYTDNSAYKETTKDPALQTSNTYYYRLQIVYTDGNNEYSDAIDVVHATSSVRKTWGMIKEMMR
jgi:hypothetical protein